MIPIGTHPAKLADYGISATQSGAPQAYFVFNCQGESITVYGSLNQTVGQGKTKSGWDVTAKNLETLGFKGGYNDVPKLYDGIESFLLDVSQDYSLVIEHETKDNVTRHRVKFINKPGAGVGKRFESKEEMMKAFATAGSKGVNSSSKPASANDFP